MNTIIPKRTPRYFFEVMYLKKLFYIGVLIVLIFMSAVLLPGCAKKESAPKKPETSMGQKPKAPPEIKKMLADIDMLIQELDKSTKEKMKSPVEQTAELEPQAQEGDRESGNQSQQGPSPGAAQGQNQEEKSEQEQPGEQSQGKSEQNAMPAASENQNQSPKDVWQQADKSIKSIHQSWNSLEPEAIKAGLEVNDRDNFEKALEELTVNISAQKNEASLMAAVSLYKYFARLTQVFATEIPPGFFQLKYEVMAAITEARQKDWPAAQERLPNIQEHWNNLKVQAQGIDTKLLNRSEFSIHDLNDAIASQQPELVSIKGEIVMKNLQQLETELAKVSKKQGQKGK